MLFPSQLKINFIQINNILKNNFGSDANKVSIIDHQHLIFESEELDKNEISRDILNALEY